MSGKSSYVRRQGQSRAHECHWPGCGRQVPPAMWGCRQHWFKLPKVLRDRIWETYEIGQEVSMTPSDEYLEAARDVQDWIKRNVPGADKPNQREAPRRPTTAMLGQEVRVKLDEHIIVTGKLLSYGDSGEFVIEDGDGFVHYCWPLLDIVVCSMPTHSASAKAVEPTTLGPDSSTA